MSKAIRHSFTFVFGVVLLTFFIIAAIDLISAVAKLVRARN